MILHDSTQPTSSSPAPLRLGIAGLGTVGRGVVHLLNTHHTLLVERMGRVPVVTAISARNRQRDRGVNLSSMRWHDDAVQLAHDPEVDIVIELIGGAEGPARALVEAALTAGKPVITANKALLALHGEHLATLSHKHNAPLLFEAAVAGGIPAIKLVREGLAGEALHYVGGILNGTCNYILTEMEKSGHDFDSVLQEAQEKGYAEAEPSTDVDGWDAAHKLAILAAIAFSPIQFDTLPVEGIRHVTATDLRFARELGYRIRLLGMARQTDDNAVEAWIRPCLVPAHSALARVDNVFNALTLAGPFSGPMTISGRGAGEGPTASAVLADVVDLARTTALPRLWGRTNHDHPKACASLERHESAFYLRLEVDDHSGVIADISSILRDQNVSVHLISQHDAPPGHDEQRAYLVVITHPVASAHIRHVVTHLKSLSCVHGTPLSLMIEELP